MASLSQQTHVPPQKPPVFTATPISIINDVNRLIEASKKVRNELVRHVTPENATFANVLLPLAHAENDLMLESNLLIFYSSVSPDKNTRDASAEARNILRDYQMEASMNEKVFALVDAVFTSPAPPHDLDAESRNYLDKTHKGFVKSGLRIPSDAERARFRQLRGRIDTLTSQFSQNLAEDETAVFFTREELQGFPEDALSRLEKGQPGTPEESKFKIDISLNLSRLLQTARNPLTRKRARLAHDNKCPANVAIFKEVVRLRHEAARILGYPSHAAFSIEDKMAGKVGRARDFLTALAAQLKDGAAAERETLLQLKRRDVESRGDEFDGRLFLWDVPFYKDLLSQDGYSVDQEAVSEYFPVQTTVRNMLGIFERLFGLVFHEITGQERDALSPSGNGDDLVWHPDVQVFAAWDSEAEGGRFLGYLYMDLYHREGKQGGPSNFSLVPGFMNRDGTRTYPSTALTCAFPLPSPKKPSLLRHFDVVLLFHELGHGIHDLVSRTQFARFHGPMGTVVDFGEAPSQVLENWCWDPTQLRELSRHYSYLSDEYLAGWRAAVAERSGNDVPQPPESLPTELVDGLLKTKQVSQGLGTLHQVFIGLFDMTIHQAPDDQGEEETITQLWNRLRRETVPTDDPFVLGEGTEWGHGYTTFGHLMDEYDAGFYSYLFSKVYAQDIFSTMFEESPMSVEAGRKYRYGVLEKGGAQPEMKTLTDFLGREARMEPFYADLGLGK